MPLVCHNKLFTRLWLCCWITLAKMCVYVKVQGRASTSRTTAPNKILENSIPFDVSRFQKRHSLCRTTVYQVMHISRAHNLTV